MYFAAYVGVGTERIVLKLRSLHSGARAKL